MHDMFRKKESMKMNRLVLKQKNRKMNRRSGSYYLANVKAKK